MAGTMALTLAVLAASVGFLLLAQRRSRSTILTDPAWKAAFLVSVAIYLGYLAQNAEAFGGDSILYSGAVAAAHLLIALFFLFLGVYLWRFARRGTDFVVVSPEFFLGMRKRLRDMYGPGPARFLAYSLAKQSAIDAVRRPLDEGLLTPARAWRRLPYLFRLMGYGRLRVVERAEGRMRVEVAGSFEVAARAGLEGCDLTRGFLAGLGEALGPGVPCEAEEIRCGAANGAGRCEFALRWFPPMQAAEAPTAIAQEARR